MANQAVSVNSNNYDPQSVPINVGDTVDWSWTGNQHSVTSDDNLWPDTGLQDAGFTFSFTFNNPGSFRYHCTRHSGMKGVVNVTDALGTGQKKY